MVKVKICGMTRPEDAAKACELGADMVGLIQVPGSPRHLSVDRVRAVLDAIRPPTQSVIVVRNPTEAELQYLRTHFSFDWFQFHGNEPAEWWARYGGYPVMGVSTSGIGLRGNASQRDQAPFLLLDTAVGRESGGLGKTFDWQCLDDLEGKIMVAGGLNPENLSDLIERHKPWGIDVSSGVEYPNQKGIKDPRALARFIDHARRAHERAHG